MTTDQSTADGGKNHDQANDLDGVHGVNVTDLVQKEGTFPFVGLTARSPLSGYPDGIHALGERYADNPESAPTYKDVIRFLPNAGEGVIWGTNDFVQPDGTGGVDVDVDAIQNVDGLDTQELEQRTGKSLDELAEEAQPEPLIEADRRKDIIDRRRLALNALGFDCRFRWQIASDRYDAGDMQEFLSRKIAACQKRGIEDAFGWVRFRDWGGVVRITTIYPDLEYDLDPSLMADLEIDNDVISLAGEDIEDAFENGDRGSGRTVYYGERTCYDYRGGQRIEVKPVYFWPSLGTMFPLESPRFTRKHLGDVMNHSRERAHDRVPLIEWYERNLKKLEKLATQVNKSIIRSQLVELEFEDLPFSIEEFYTLLGIPQGYAEQAAINASSFTETETCPSLWNLQVSLKMAILQDYSGSKASDRYSEFQEIASQIMRFPSQQIQLALEEWQIQQMDDPKNDEQILPEDQQTLAESVEDIAELPGVRTEEELSIEDAQALEDGIQHRLPEMG